MVLDVSSKTGVVPKGVSLPTSTIEQRLLQVWTTLEKPEIDEIARDNQVTITEDWMQELVQDSLKQENELEDGVICEYDLGDRNRSLRGGRGGCGDDDDELFLVITRKDMD